MLLLSAFLASMAIINGATTLDEVVKTVKAGFFSVIRVCTFLHTFQYAHQHTQIDILGYISFIVNHCPEIYTRGGELTREYPPQLPTYLLGSYGFPSLTVFNSSSGYVLRQVVASYSPAAIDVFQHASETITDCSDEESRAGEAGPGDKGLRDRRMHIHSFTRDIMYENHELSNSFLLLKVLLVGNAALWLG